MTQFDSFMQPYFLLTCRSVLAPFFRFRGFPEVVEARTSIRFGRGGVFSSFGYWLEDSPRFLLLIGLESVRPTAFGSRRGQLGLWRVLSTSGEEPVWWPFSDEDELTRLL